MVAALTAIFGSTCDKYLSVVRLDRAEANRDIEVDI